MDPRSNILFIFPDQWRGDSLSYLGHPVALTPFLDELASSGTVFRAAYSNCPVCIPARASLAMGQSPSTVGRLAYRDEINWNYHPTFMHRLRDSGYQTMLTGKTHFFPPRNHLGFEQLAIYDNQRHHWPGFKSDYDLWLERQTGGLIDDTAQQLNSNSMLVEPWKHDEALHANSWTVTAALDMLERRDPTRPFFLQLGFHRPHPPIDPPLEYYERFAHADLPEPPVGDWVDFGDHHEYRIDHIQGRIDPRLFDRARRGYYAQLAHLDFQVGRILRWLQLRHMLGNTLIVFSSDHGEHLGDHRLYRKSSALEGSLRIPMVVCPPRGDAPRGVVRDEPVALFDIMPTVLEAAGLPIPDDVEARSLLPLVRGDDASWRSHIHAEQSNGPFGPWQCVTDGKRKYIWITTTGRELLFNLEADPQETRNLAGDPAYAGELAVWRSRLVEELRARPEDGLTDGDTLRPGRQVPVVRDWVLEAAGMA